MHDTIVHDNTKLGSTDDYLLFGLLIMMWTTASALSLLGGTSSASAQRDTAMGTGD